MSLLDEGRSEPGWSASLSDSLFVPPKQFEARRNCRKFLGWLLELGLPVGKWLDQLDGTGTGVHAPPSFWAGAVGRAYPIGDRYVVKLTSDRKEAEFASSVVGVERPHMARVYGVRRISVGDRFLYAVVQERLATGMPGKYRIAATAVYKYLDNFCLPVKDVEKVAAAINSDPSMISPKYRADPAVQSGIRSILRSVKDMYDADGIHYVDTHGANLGFKGAGQDRRVAMFDFGRSLRFDGSKPPEFRDLVSRTAAAPGASSTTPK